MSLEEVVVAALKAEAGDPDWSWELEAEAVLAALTSAGYAVVADPKQIASSGGVSQLHKIINLIDVGYTPDRIKEWCEKQIRRRPR